MLDLLPAGLTFVSAVASQGTYTSGTGIWLVGVMNNAASATLTINANVTTVGAKINTAQVSYADNFDPDSIPGNSNAAEDDQASVTVTPSPDLQIAKTAISTFAVGVNGSYSIAVNNTLGSAPTVGTYTVTDNSPRASPSSPPRAPDGPARQTFRRGRQRRRRHAHGLHQCHRDRRRRTTPTRSP